MIPTFLKELAEVLQVHSIGDNMPITQIGIDSRAIKPGALFVALKGEKFDGHHFTDEAQSHGAVGLLVERLLPIKLPQIVVPNTLKALWQLAAWVRQQVNPRLVALTGSSGKTSVKEMTAAILRQSGHVLYTKGNYNNCIGVPLTLLRLTPEHDFAVLELGASQPGDIADTAALSRPENVLITNLAQAHLSGFGSFKGVAKAKGEILTALAPTGTAIIHASSHDWPKWKSVFRGKRLWRFCLEKGKEIDFFASHISKMPLATDFTLHSPLGSQKIYLPLPGLHNVLNALAASALAISVGADLSAISKALSELKPMLGRAFPIILGPGKLLLDDTYNANVGSMIAATEMMSNMPGYRVMVVGDMAELGEQSKNCHKKIGNVMRQAGIDKVFSFGYLSKFMTDSIEHGEHFTRREKLIKRVQDLLLGHSEISILVKGSRSSAMEKLVLDIKEQASC
ncbi:UDP-N-acetylmuramoyl-tripeptide--D-alanyl-D-alanine ligase [Candidatus Williamhamiltonella defendens]|uniref:UDP-N-acetylmuramoyl-tripeptide--D-alanyl-D- alanine ligase n=1 Tax=Candidatus Williamhamiltonella defendens TaxID=138072 RepID=UPI00130DBB2A|nr:UDP-N-acetylmuramoyl-tripeptide--D-alanyl-D-alanine ligase [Candidatus Hamiltonella defensa]